MALHKWSQTAADNDDADEFLKLRDEIAPSVMNDNLRNFMAEVAKYRDDTNGSIVTTGTSTAYIVTGSQSLTPGPANYDGYIIVARIHTTSGANPTLGVHTLIGSTAIQDIYGNAIPEGGLVEGSIHTFSYNLAASAWIVHSGSDVGIESGTSMLFQQTSAPVGWTKLTDHNNKAIRVTSGSVSTGGTLSFTDCFQDRTMTTSQMPAHSHSGSSLGTDSQGSHGHTYTRYSSLPDNFQRYGGWDGAYKGTSTQYTSWQDDHTHTVSGSTNSAGSANPIAFAVQYVDVIRCTKD